MNCQHTNFSATVQISNLSDTGRWMSEIKISCAECGVPFAFKGLPIGANLDGAAVSADGTEARIAVEPVVTKSEPLKVIFLDGPAIDRAMDIPQYTPFLKVPLNTLKRTPWNDGALEKGFCVAIYKLVGINKGFREARYTFVRMEP